MTRAPAISLTITFLFLLPFTILQSLLPAAEHGFAATVNPLATEAALGAMKAGGNAVDGAIAAAITLGVVDQHNSGIGGGLFMLIRSPDGTFTAIDGREMAPTAATRDMFLRNGQPDPKLAQEGPLAAAVPGWLAALDHAAGHFGKLPLARPLREAAELAAEGFQPDPGFLERRKTWTESLSRHPETAAILLAPLREGKLKLPDLAQSYRHIADQGIAWFYGGPFAEKTEAWMKANGGIMTAADLKNYQVKRREPLRSSYRGHEIIGFPPPSSGGVHVAEILNILETFDLKSMEEGSPDFIHLVTEAMKPAFADRAHWLGDPDFAKVPRGLIDPAYARALAQKIDRAKATPVPSHGEPPAAGSDVFSKHTTHFSITDSDGWCVACTATINNTWGSLVTIPGTGILLNDEMDDFSVQPGVPNVFGLIGGEANAVAPGKRPLSSMSPTIVLKDGQPVLVIGAAGGPTIITQVLLGIIRVIDYGQTPAQALAGPRFHHQWRPDALRIERRVPEATRNELEKRGHTLNVLPAIGVSQAIARNPNGTFTGASDPRVSGTAAGF